MALNTGTHTERPMPEPRTYYRVEYRKDGQAMLVGYYDDINKAMSSMDDIIPLRDHSASEYYHITSFEAVGRPEDAWEYSRPIKQMRFGISES